MSNLSSSDRFVHWNKKPRSRIVFRKGDLIDFRAASSLAAISSIISVSNDSSVAVEKRRNLLLLLFVCIDDAPRASCLGVVCIAAITARLRVETVNADVVVATMAEVREAAIFRFIVVFCLCTLLLM